MKAAILAGGLGTRLSEETVVKPKPMVEIGDRPILWHIMKHYSHFGVSEFCVALGYKGEFVKRFFLDYFTLNGSMTLNLGSGESSSTRLPAKIGAFTSWTRASRPIQAGAFVV